MVQHFLELSDAEVLPIVALRMGDTARTENTFLNEIMEIDEAVMCLDKAEEKEVRQQQDTAKSCKAENLVFQKRYTEKLVAVQAAQAAARPKPKAKARARAPPAPDPVRPLPQGDLTQAQIKHLCPPGGSVWRANVHGSWMGHFPPLPRVSFPWNVYGHRYSAVKLLRNLWESWAMIHGMVLPRDCPIVGLFHAEGEADAAAVVG